MESKGEKFNPLIGIVSAAFATETVLFITSAFIAIRARANAIVRIENEEIDALLQGKIIKLFNQIQSKSHTHAVATCRTRGWDSLIEFELNYYFLSP